MNDSRATAGSDMPNPTTPETVQPQWVNHLETQSKEVSKELDAAITAELADKPKDIMVDTKSEISNGKSV